MPSGTRHKTTLGPRSKQSGFTLIELMIVVALIGFAAVFGYTFYQKHAARDKITQGLKLADNAKTAVEKKYRASGTSAPRNKGYGLPPANRINNDSVKSISVGQQGLITIAYKNDVPTSGQSGNTLVLAPQVNNGSIAWQCGSRNIVKTYLPDQCGPNLPTPSGISASKGKKDKNGKDNGQGGDHDNKKSADSDKKDSKNGDSKSKSSDNDDSSD